MGCKRLTKRTQIKTEISRFLPIHDIWVNRVSIRLDIFIRQNIHEKITCYNLVSLFKDPYV